MKFLLLTALVQSVLGYWEIGHIVETDCLGALEVVQQIGKGRNAVVFKAIQTKDPTKVYAIKASSSPDGIAREAHVLQALDGANGFPHFFCIGEGFLVMQFMDGYKSLDKLESLPMGIEDVAIALIDRLEAVHHAGFVHVDVHKRNIMLKTSEIEGTSSPVILLDFGLAVPLREPKTSDQVNLFLASVCEQARVPLHPIDDIERLMYVLLHYEFGPLPWALQAEMHREMVKNEAPSKEVSVVLHSLEQRILQLKQEFLIGEGTDGFFETQNVPIGFRKILEYIAQSRPVRDSMSFSVDYRYLKAMMREGRGDPLPVRELTPSQSASGHATPTLLPVV